MIDDPRVYYVEDCYALRGCFHCPDCLAFALKFYKQSQLIQDNKDDMQAKRDRTLVIKFILSTVASENLPFEFSLSSDNLRDYINKIFDGTSQLPNCHYEFR